ncbi:MAG: hypothetical protein BJ554DRAFT_7572 [Olpidium bornovanus]|uniref:ABC transporter domain-containing protein n=1 Tax=Olpidium bornovanus TaxID=278681 RepID=A0A8H8DML6_9FUNG|nr:MAG: hypothetical protein BJ554DRAFT_7572 [Olpidium bornovanus]
MSRLRCAIIVHHRTFARPRPASRVCQKKTCRIIYPHSLTQMRKEGRTDEDLLKILRLVHLAYIPEREGGWETKKEWKDVFSGGEKQRVGMARLFYHHPKYAILDECKCPGTKALFYFLFSGPRTSAVSADVEWLMYSEAKEMGISMSSTEINLPLNFAFLAALVTISHRPSLFKYHKFLLRLSGDHGQWELSKIGADEESVSRAHEIARLKERLADVDALRRRVEEINKELRLGTNSGIHSGEPGRGGR